MKITLELQNLTTMSLGAHTIKFGTRLRDNREANSSMQASTAASAFKRWTHTRRRIQLRRNMEFSGFVSELNLTSMLIHRS